jgi:uncharacterized protein YqeY
MSLKQQILDDLKAAMKAREKVRLDTVRMVKAKMQEREVELRAKHGRDYVLDDAEALTVLSQAAKQRRDSIESFRHGGRDDLADREEAELAIIEGYLPRQLSDEEVREIVGEAIAEAGAATPADMGKVMKIVMPKVKGRADGKMVNQTVKSMLAPPAKD